MANTVKVRRSATPSAVPTIAQLALGEIAVNTYDGKMFIKKDVSGTQTIVEISGGGGGTITQAIAGDSGTDNVTLGTDTLTFVGGTGITSAITNNTVTFDIDSTVATLTGTQTLTNKTLTSPVISTIVNTGTLTLPTSTDTLVGRATTDTLTNKTLTSPVISGGSINNATIGATTASTGAFTSVTTPSVTATTTDLTLSAISTGAVKLNTVGGTQFQVNNTASAVNYVQVTGSVASPGPSALGGLSFTGSDTNPNFAIGTKGTGYIAFYGAATSNWQAFRINTTNARNTGNLLEVQGALAGSAPSISAISGSIGTDANIDITLIPKGTGVVAVNGGMTVSGDLTVNGTTTTINSTTISVDDKNIELGSVATPTNTTADGGGITLKGATDKTLNWVNATSAWTSSEDFNLLTGKVYEINGTSVLSATTLGSGVTGSSLTSVGTIGTGVWQGTVVGPSYGGTGVNNGSSTFTIGGNVTHSGAFTTTFTTTANTSVILPTTGTLATLAGTETLTNKTLTSPTLTTPVLGTPTSGNFSTGTFTWPTFNQSTTGSAATLTTARNINGTSFNGSTDITTANWGTARTITIGATGKSVNGSAAVSWTLDELQSEYRQPNNTIRNNLGDPTAREMALFHGQFNNKFRFIPATTQEESTDGTTWTTSTRATANQLADIMLGEGQSGTIVAIPTGTVGTFGAYRLTWDVVGTVGYVYLNNLYFYNSTNGNSITALVEAFHNTTGWTTITGPHNFGNWPGHTTIPHSVIAYSSSASQYGKVRVTFTSTHNTNTNSFDLYGVEWFGGYPAGKRNVESYDRLKNVTFPAAITATGSLTIGTDGGYAAGSIYSDASWGMIFRAKQPSPTQAEYRWATSADTELARLSTAGNLTVTGTVAGTNITTGGNVTGTSTNVTGTVAIANGGTGATTNTAARTNLGATTVGSNFFTLTNPSAVTFPRINADNTVSSLDAATFRTAIGAGTGSGTVTGVTATSPVASSGGTAPVISLSAGYGDTLNPYASKTANFVLAAPNGSAGVPTFRAIVAADIPTLNQNTTGNAATASTTPLVSVDNSIAYGRGGLQFVQVSGLAGDTATTTNTPTNDWWHIIRPNHANAAGYYTDLALPMTIAGNIRYRRISAGVSSGWITVLDGTNYNSYAPTLTGTGASGSWGISVTGSSASCTGNAATATSATNVTGTVAVANGGTGVTTSTGTGSVVLSASPTFTGTIGAANLTLSGDLTVNGTTTTINSTTISVDDKNIELGSVASPSDVTADGGGITLKGATDKTINWGATNGWTSSETFNIATGKTYKINGTDVLSATTLGSGVTGSSLTSVGTIATGVWQGSLIAGQYGGTGVNNSGKTITIGGNFTHTGAHTLGLTTTAATSVTLPTTGTLATLAGTETLTNKTIAAGSNTITGLTNSNLSGTAGITNANLANSTITVGSTSIALGATSTTLAGLTTVTSNNVIIASGEGNAVGFWTGNTTYSIAMGVTAGTYQYGPVIDYSIKTSMGGGAGRGFTWGQYGVKPIAALNATSGDMQIAGTFSATAKSFLIDHPTKPNMKLRYGSLEGPENGVYVRGRLTGNTIELPDYWLGLVHEDSITVSLTPIGKHQKLYVEDIIDNTVIVGNENLFGKIDCFYTVFAERKDVDKLEVEI